MALCDIMNLFSSGREGEGRVGAYIVGWRKIESQSAGGVSCFLGSVASTLSAVRDMIHLSRLGRCLA